MAQALLFAALASLCLGFVVESLICKECLMETDEDGCLFTVGICKAVDSCRTFIVSDEENVLFRVYGCFVSASYPCGMKKKSYDGQILSVKCCSQSHLCNRKVLN